MGTPFSEWKQNSILCWIDYETTGITIEDNTVVPIEVGFMFSDMDLKPLNLDGVQGFTTLIDWGFDGIKDWSEWGEEAVEAFPYHKLTPQAIVEQGMLADHAAVKMLDVVRRMTPEGGRCVMISDNIQFEWQFTKLLLEAHPAEPDAWPFHYCGWDTSVLQLVHEIQFRDPPDPPHRAMQDVIDLWMTARVALRGKTDKCLDRALNIGVGLAT